MASESDMLWLIARFYMENRRGYGLTTHLAPLQEEAVALLSAATGRDIAQTEDSEIAALLQPPAVPEAKG